MHAGTYCNIRLLLTIKVFYRFFTKIDLNFTLFLLTARLNPATHQTPIWRPICGKQPALRMPILPTFRAPGPHGGSALSSSPIIGHANARLPEHCGCSLAASCKSINARSERSAKEYSCNLLWGPSEQQQSATHPTNNDRFVRQPRIEKRPGS